MLNQSSSLAEQSSSPDQNETSHQSLESHLHVATGLDLMDRILNLLLRA